MLPKRVPAGSNGESDDNGGKLQAPIAASAIAIDGKMAFSGQTLASGWP